MGRQNIFDVIGDGVNVDTGREQIEYISIDLIVPDPENFYELSGIDELASNIALCGLQQPIRVRPMGGDDSQVMILSGHRRHAAIRKLIEEGREDLRDVPCIVEDHDGESPEMTKLRLIYANASTRVMSSAEQAKQAEEVERLLVALRDQGQEFPGRMRDHVAQVCKMSTGKLARLKFIKKNLHCGFKERWEEKKLSDEAADIIAHMPYYRQVILLDAQRNNFITVSGAKHLAEVMEQKEAECGELECVRGGKCSHGQTRCAMAAHYDHCYGGCCFDCHNLAQCKHHCLPSSFHRAGLKAQIKAQNQTEAKAKQEAEAPDREWMREVYTRVKAMREERGISQEGYLKATWGHTSKTDLEKLEKAENGIANLKDRFPGGIWLDEVKTLCRIADMLGCSIDYLLGHSEHRTIVRPAPGWKTGVPEQMGSYAAVIDISPAEPIVKRLWFDGDDWYLKKAVGDPIGGEMQIAYWMELPEEVAPW